MKKLHPFFALLCSAMILLSCQDKTRQLLAKKWDCVQIENLAPMDKHLMTAQDSADNAKITAALQSLVWTFNNNNTYSCSINIGTTIQGTYEIADDEKSLVMIPASKNNINRYIITSLTEYELTLTSTGISQPIIMHFRPH